MTTSNAFGSTFAVFPNAQSQTKNCKRATKPTHNDRHNGQTTTLQKKQRTPNSTYNKLAR